MIAGNMRSDHMPIKSQTVCRDSAPRFIRFITAQYCPTVVVQQYSTSNNL